MKNFSVVQHFFYKFKPRLSVCFFWIIREWFYKLLNTNLLFLHSFITLSADWNSQVRFIGLLCLRHQQGRFNWKRKAFFLFQSFSSYKFNTPRFNKVGIWTNKKWVISNGWCRSLANIRQGLTEVLGRCTSIKFFKALAKILSRPLLTQ